MEIIGATSIKDGVEQDLFYIKCSKHEFYYKGMPPLTSGCSDCWHTYFYGQAAQSGGDFKGNVDQLESAIRHAAELASKGEFDFKPDYQVEFGEE